MKYDELEINFVALGCKSQIHSALESRKIQAHIDVSKFFLNDMGEKCRISIDKVIDTESNLPSLVLQDIMNSLGLDYSLFEAKANLIDECLLSNRNCIAHGENLTIDVAQFFDLCDDVIAMMIIFKNLVSNSASMKLYKRHAPKVTR